METINSLQPTDPLAQEAIVSLLGATLSELKKLDSAVVDGSSRLQTVNKIDLNKILAPHRGSSQPVYNINLPGAIPPPAPTLPPQQSPSQQPLPNQSNIQNISVEEDPNQLVFDFNKPITPETINNKLDIITSKLDRILDKLS